jgi:hypothetical protein
MFSNHSRQIINALFPNLKLCPQFSEISRDSSAILHGIFIIDVAAIGIDVKKKAQGIIYL